MANAQWVIFDGVFSGDGADLPYDRLILDDLESSVYQAYSLRRMRQAYEGKAVTVRRSSDNATLDIGFTAAGLLDTAALLAFAGANSAYVTTWFDQSGNSRNMTQSTTAKQPRIVNAGALVTMLNAPAVEFNGANCHLRHTAPALRTLIPAGGASVVEVHTIKSGYVSPYVEGNFNVDGIMPFRWDAATTPNLFGMVKIANAEQFGSPSYAAGAVNDVHSDVFIKPTAAGASLYRDGLLKASNTTWNPPMPTSAVSAVMGGFEYAAGSIGDAYTGKIGEHILLSGVASATDRESINDSQVAYFGI